MTADKLIAVQDWRLHNVRNYAYGVIKLFVLCRKTGGSFVENVETTETGYFGREKLPDNLATEKPQQNKSRCALTHITTKTGKRSSIKSEDLKT